MARLDDLIEELREQGRDEDADELERLRGSTLRRKAARAEELEQKLQELEAELEEARAAPQREKALREYGVLFDELKPAEREIIAGLKGQLTPELIGELVERYQLPVAAPEQAEEPEEPAAARIAQRARQAPPGKAAPVLSPGDVAEWPIDRLMRLREKYPEEYEALKRGETVTGVAL